MAPISQQMAPVVPACVYPLESNEHIRKGLFDIQGWDFFLKKLFVSAQEQKMSSKKLKIRVCSSLGAFFDAPFPGSYKDLQITQKLT